jgi:hypothetical protein
MRRGSCTGRAARLVMRAVLALTAVAAVAAAATATVAAEGNAGFVAAAADDRVLVAEGGFGVPRLIATGGKGIACVSADRDVLSFARHEDRSGEGAAVRATVAAGEATPRRLLGGRVYCPEAACASDGTAIVAAQTPRGVMASVRRPGGDFGPARRVSPGRYDADISVAAAPGGWTAIAWQRTSSKSTTLRLRITAPDGATRSGSIATATERAPLYASAVAVDAAGGAIVTATRGEESKLVDVLVSVVAPGAMPGAAKRIGKGVGVADIDYEVAPVAAATDPEGHIVASWQSSRGLVTATGTTRAGLDAPRRVPDLDAQGSPVVRVNDTGAAIVAYGAFGNDSYPTVDVIGRPARDAPFSPPHDVLTGRPATKARSAGDEDDGESPGIVRLNAMLGEDGRAAVVFNGYVDEPGPAGEEALAAFGVSLAATRAADGTWRSAEVLSRPSRNSEVGAPALGLSPQGAPRAYYVEDSSRSGNLLKTRELWPAVVPADRAPPVVTATLAAGTRVGSKGIGPVRIRVRCNEACDALAELGSYVLTVTTPLRGGVETTLALKPYFKDLSRIRFTPAQRRAGRARLPLRLVVSDALGNTRILRRHVLVRI